MTTFPSFSNRSDMFAYEDRSSSVGRCLLHLFMAPLASSIFGAILTLLFEHVLPFGSLKVREVFVAYFGFPVAGLLLGYTLQAAFPYAFRIGGRWVWIFPVCILGGAILDGLKRNPNEAAALFVPSSVGEGGIGMLFFTWPALASIFYALGVALAGWRKRARSEGGSDGRIDSM